MRTVKVFEEAWPLHTPFVIARGSRSEAHVVVVELEEEGIKGTGECTPYPRYGESDASVMAQIMSVVPQLEKGLTREELQKILPAGAARNALDCALWDLAARKQQQSLADLIGITLPGTVTTAQSSALRAAPAGRIFCNSSRVSPFSNCGTTLIICAITEASLSP